MNRILLAILAISLGSGLAQAKDKYYTEDPLFHFTPDPNAPTNTIGRLGPIGLGLELRKPNFTMHISNVEEGSPAAKTGKLRKGQIIESINGEVLKDIDPRVQLGNLITEIEASDGVVRLMVKDKPKAEASPIEFRIPVLGSYSDTWPMNCAKSEAIVKNMAQYLREADNWGWGAALFLLSTGDPQDLEAVRQRFSGKLDGDNPGFPWPIGYTGIAICEYYLKTGDKSVLPAIQARHDYLLERVYNDSWMGRGGANFNYVAGGHLNAAGLHAVTFLLMARECGVDVDEEFLKNTFRHLYRYAGRGNVAYGDHMPEGGMTDNGKVGKLTFVLQAAANLTPKGEQSIYANARDISATKSFYNTSWLFHGHTGGGIGEFWRGPAMGMVKEKRPSQYRSFMDERRWVYELARTYQGAFGWAAGQNVNYTGVNTGKPNGNYIPLIYTLPRKQLRIFGAPATQYSQTYELPERIWGTAADDAFYSLTPGAYAPGKRMDISHETIPNSASKEIFKRIKANDVTEEVLHAYALHIDQGIRDSTVAQIRKRGWDHIIMKLLRSEDPRGRHSGLMGVGALPKPMSDQVAGILIDMIEDENESWWVVMEALQQLQNASADQLGPHLAAIEKWLNHSDWWLQASAMRAATPLVTDERYYKQLIPAIAELMSTSQRASMPRYFNDIAKQCRKAPRAVQEFAREHFSQAYAQYPEMIAAPGGQDMSNGTNYMLRHAAKAVAQTPGGLDALYAVAKKRFPNASLPHKELYLEADPQRLGPELQESMRKIILEDLIPEYIGKGHHPQSNRGYLMNEATSSEPLDWGFYYREPRMAGLVELYQRAGIDDYNWKDYGPKWTEMTWQYHTFDPPEQKTLGTGTRFREVTVPAGMEDWFKPGFDPRKAGWKSGQQPFGQKNGELVERLRGCGYDFCRCNEPMQTLWKNEAMLMHGKFHFPEFKEGHRYRILVGGMSHVNAGDGFRVYVGGEQMFERERGVGRREGAKPLTYYIDKAWWPNFAQDKTTIAAMSFLRMGQNSSRRHFSIWLQEMKAPPMGRDVILHSATKTPMRSAEWQSLQDTMRNTGEDDGKYVWDGEYVPNPKVQGSWTQLGQVQSIEEFVPGEPIKRNRRARFQEITFMEDGATGDGLVIWSDNMLLDLRKNEALRITPETINGMEYLFIEAGGFNTREGPDWTPPLFVMKRNQG
ncbi:hypothetical protein DDZ13_14285 [Coraliomargarita sinensis]|uniref:PDZ domain-containing protein n=1 Tax=Coraliomargarita sinensis TaxID=2174842 RepID=A0A317ZE50_9BACT|nr:DUF6288 domain-containing protein [Coraliomargarita sinensis]PXA02952.1 hypothetical protein DDZ13_14285 [Coraliomargarita sinensis]